MESLAQAELAHIEGTFYRHTSVKVRSLKGSSAGGRWGSRDGTSVLYLGRPVDSVVAEAYRNLVDDIEGMTGDLVGPRRLMTCNLKVTNILDLRDQSTRVLAGLTEEDLSGPWEPCQLIGRASHMLGFHGVIAPAATQLGETLALFEQHLDEGELPELVSEEVWAQLPSDPRVLREVRQRSVSGDET